jgi:hypothetical protein
MKTLTTSLLLLLFIPLQEDIEVKEYKYTIRPNDKYTTRSYPTDSIRRDTTRRYIYEFWVGDDGINYGTKNRR